ncbi:MAG: Diaminopimelate epimerase [Chlamydiae bacterium]|nr:Diaminopimelate epimerase [Chlamydiota bacterium]
MRYPYTLYSGAGNTFALLDARTNLFPHEEIPSLCKKCKIDGVLLLEKGEKTPYQMSTFNKDGSRADMCGNGLRTMVAFLEELGEKEAKYAIETPAGIYHGWKRGEEICIQLPSPKVCKWDLTISLAETPLTIHLLHTGVPHAVCFVDKIEEIDVEKRGKELRFHPKFGPSGTNVTFVSKNPARIRTYERGVEGETQACGTGAVAAALALAKCHDTFSPISIEVASGDILKVSFTPDWSRITLQGPVEKIGGGQYSTVALKGAIS